MTSLPSWIEFFLRTAKENNTTKPIEDDTPSLSSSQISCGSVMKANLINVSFAELCDV